jgi:hypothetical protein
MSCVGDDMVLESSQSASMVVLLFEIEELWRIPRSKLMSFETAKVWNFETDEDFSNSKSMEAMDRLFTSPESWSNNLIVDVVRVDDDAVLELQVGIVEKVFNVNGKGKDNDEPDELEIECPWLILCKCCACDLVVTGMVEEVDGT